MRPPIKGGLFLPLPKPLHKDNIVHVFPEYKPEYARDLARLHAKYASASPGYPVFMPEHWEMLFLKTGVNPRSDVILTMSENRLEPGEISGFSWIYTGALPSRIILRGPYIDISASRCNDLLRLHFNEAIRRSRVLSAEFLEARSIYPAWEVVLAQMGFRIAGEYSRMRLFPVRGDLAVAEIPADCEFRHWKGLSDLGILSELFSAVFKNHWDYIPPNPGSWREVVTSEFFEPDLTLFLMKSGKAAGYAFGEQLPDPSVVSLQSAYLVSIGVLPEYRGQGFGPALLSWWLRSVYGLKLKSSELDVDSINKSAIKMYEGFGYRKIRSEKVWRFSL